MALRDAVRVWREGVESERLDLIPGPQLMEGFDELLESGSGDIVAQVYATSNGNPIERWASPSPQRVLQAAEVVLRPRVPPPGPASTDWLVTPFFGADWADATDTFTYLQVPSGAGAPSPPGVRYQLFQPGLGAISTQVGELYRQEENDLYWADHWVLWTNFVNITAASPLRIVRDPAAATLTDFLGHHHTSHSQARYALVELNWRQP